MALGRIDAEVERKTVAPVGGDASVTIETCEQLGAEEELPEVQPGLVWSREGEDEE
jgi:hypothetical protein